MIQLKTKDKLGRLEVIFNGHSIVTERIAITASPDDFTQATITANVEDLDIELEDDQVLWIDPKTMHRLQELEKRLEMIPTIVDKLIDTLGNMPVEDADAAVKLAAETLMVHVHGTKGRVDVKDSALVRAGGKCHPVVNYHFVPEDKA